MPERGFAGIRHKTHRRLEKENKTELLSVGESTVTRRSVLQTRRKDVKICSHFETLCTHAKVPAMNKKNRAKLPQAPL